MDNIWLIDAAKFLPPPMRQDLVLHLVLLHTLTQKNQLETWKLLSKIVLMSALFEEKPLFVPRVEIHCHHSQNLAWNSGRPTMPEGHEAVDLRLRGRWRRPYRKIPSFLLPTSSCFEYFTAFSKETDSMGRNFARKSRRMRLQEMEGEQREGSSAL